jgi:hypothetical protein
MKFLEFDTFLSVEYIAMETFTKAFGKYPQGLLLELCRTLRFNSSAVD